MSTTVVFHLPGKHDQSSHGHGGGGGGNSDSFDERAAKATTGPAAVEMAAVHDPSDAQRAAIDKYGGDASYVVNADLRTTGKPQGKHEAMVENLDSLMGSSPLSEDVVVYRNVLGQDVFGDAFGSDMTGIQWRDAGYVSTSHSERPRFYQATTMRILAPKGTPGFSHRDLDRDEILLGRGLKFEVIADNGTTSATRHLDVMVVADD